MNPQLKKALWLLLRIVVSLLLLAVLFREPGLKSRLAARLQDMGDHLEWVLAGFGCVTVTILLMTLRWWLVLRPHVPEARPLFLLRATLVAWFFSVTTLGALGGDAWRIIEVRRRFPGHGVSAGVSVLVEHAAGLVAALVFLLITGSLALFYADASSGGMQGLFWQLALVMLVLSGLMTMALGSISPPFLRRFGQYTPAPCRAFVDTASERMVVVLQDRRTLVRAGVVSLALLTTHFLTFYCGLRAVGGASALLPLFLAMPLVDLAASLPISVAGLGVREKTFESLMHALTGMPVDISVSASLAGWLLTLTGGLVGGVLFAMGRSRRAERAP